jgi:uncharacterized protein YkwD
MRASTIARTAALAGVLATSVSLLPAQASAARTAGSTSSLASLESGVLFKLNQIRRSHGLVPLKLNSALTAAATQHSDEMLADGYFAHASVDGSAFWKRIAKYYPSAGYQNWSVGENLLWDGGPLGPKGALDLWMASPDHRANILDPSWREIGVVAIYDANAPGVFAGYPVTLVATDFGART